MGKRPASITIVSWLLIASGSIALVGGFWPPAQRLAEISKSPLELGLAQVVRILGIIAGVFMLRGHNWARWLAVLWLAFHVGLSIGHSPLELVIHCLLFVVVVFFLFRTPASAYFRRGGDAGGSEGG
jgi:hypothetical protein